MSTSNLAAFKADVNTFKKDMLKKYNIKAYVISDAKDKKLDLETLEECVMKVMENFHPELIPYWRSKKLKTRTPDFITYCTVFTFFAKNTGYTFSRIGQFINRKHCSVIHQYKTAKHRLITLDPLFLETYVRVSKRIANYTGIIPADPEITKLKE